MAKTSINEAIMILKRTAIILNSPKLVVILVKNTITITILSIKAGCVEATTTDDKRRILEVPKITIVLNANTMAQP